MKIKYRVLFTIVFLGLVPLASFMTWEYYQTKETLKQRSFEQLKSVRELKKNEIERYFFNLREEAFLFAQSNTVVNAMKDFKTSFDGLKVSELSEEDEGRLRDYYNEEIRVWNAKVPGDIHVSLPSDKRSILLQNQYLVASKEEKLRLPYNEVHDKYHNTISSFLKYYELHDLMLIDDETGNIVYSVNKEIDFSTSLLSGAFSNTNLGRLFRKIRYTGLKYETRICDFERYLPSGMAPAAFIAAPIFEGETKIGTLVMQIPLDRIDAITTSERQWQEQGLGSTGETYIVGADFKMRTDSRFLIESPSSFFKILDNNSDNYIENQLIKSYKTTVLFKTINNAAVQKALARTSGTISIVDYRGVQVLNSFAPLNIKDVSWILITEIDAEEIFGAINRRAKKSLIIFLAVLTALVISSLLLAKSIYKPIIKLANATQELGKGNLGIKVDICRKDELGLLSSSFNKTVDFLSQQRREIEFKNNLLTQQKEELTSQAEKLQQLNETILDANNRLEEKVKERTAKLQDQNNILTKYAFTNSHKLRSPVATILGLMNLINISKNEEERRNALVLLHTTALKLDQVIYDIQDSLNFPAHPQ